VDRVVGEVDEERPGSPSFDEAEHLVGEPVGELVADGVEVGVLGEAEGLGEDDGVEPLAARRDRPGSAAAQVPHAEEGGLVPRDRSASGSVTTSGASSARLSAARSLCQGEPGGCRGSTTV